MMLICDRKHDRIIYDSNESEDCPVCEAKEELHDAEQELCGKEHELSDAEAAITQLEEHIKILQEQTT